jgi:VWFA-related protein
LVLVGFPSMHAMPQAPSASPAQAALELVPVNVRVLDRSGKPVTDLKQTDFTVTEDDVPQLIRHFAIQTLTPEAAPADTGLSLRKGLTLAPQNRRLFVLVLGLGRLEEPSGYISGLLRFVSTRLLPQDQVALFAYDRALPFTTDRQKVVAALERFKKSHEDVDFALGQELGATGMAPLYGNRVLPKKLQTKIDELVLGPGAKPAAPTTAEAIDHQAFGEMSLDDVMASTATTLLDHSNLAALMEYLRRFEGEKHVLYVTEKGFAYPSEGNDRALASVANDARASIHSLQAGGMLSGMASSSMNSTVMQARAFRSLRAIAELTGGVAAISEKAQGVLDRLDETTRTGYLIGYQASNKSWDGGYRKIAVSVNRPDVTIMFRRGYFREQTIGGFDRRAFVTNDRVFAAATFRREVNDIKVKASASQRGDANLTVEGKIDLSKIKFVSDGGTRVVQLRVAAYCFDSAASPKGAGVQTLALVLNDEEYARALKGGYTFAVQFPNVPGTQNIRFIVYDFGSDLIGRVDINVF